MPSTRDIFAIDPLGYKVTLANTWPGSYKFPTALENKNHPNPWTYPTPLDVAFTYQWVDGTPTQIFKGYKRGEIKKDWNILERDPVFTQMGKAAKYGFVLGSIYSLSDVFVVNMVEGVRNQLARYLYVMAPFPLMTVSYVGMREMLEKKAFDNQSLMPYALATLAPAAIWGSVNKDMGRGFRLFLFGSLFSVGYKVDCDAGGYFLHPNRDGKHSMMPMDPDSKVAKRRWHTPTGWKDLDNYGLSSRKEMEAAGELEPSWYQHVSEEERKRGPRPGL